MRFRKQKCAFAQSCTKLRFDVFSRNDEMEARMLIAGCSKVYKVAKVRWALVSVHHMHKKYINSR